MPEVKTEIQLLNITQNPGELIEEIAEDSYQTQRFAEKKHPRLVKFMSGRVVPFDELSLDEDPEIGKPLPGYHKDDVAVSEIIPATWIRVVKFLLAIGHHKPFETCHATFRFKNITRKAALHLLRYEFCVTNMQSQKYQPQNGFNFLLPESDEAAPGARRAIMNSMVQAQASYEHLRSMNIDPEWSRCSYPNNIAQTMTFSTNFRQLRHMFDCLCDDDYVTENQRIMMAILQIMKLEVPEFVYDYIISQDGKSAERRGSKYARNKNVNWMLTPTMKEELGLEVPKQPKGEETDIP